MKICSVINCGRLHSCKGLCVMHYLRMYRYGRLERLPKSTSSKKIPSLPYMHKIRFGGLREEVLKRDKYQCVMCGMTNAEHKEKWNCNLTINHINHKGRHSTQPDNRLENLETLCLRCHGHKDGLIHGRYSVYQPESEVRIA